MEYIVPDCRSDGKRSARIIDIIIMITSCTHYMREKIVPFHERRQRKHLRRGFAGSAGVCTQLRRQPGGHSDNHGEKNNLRNSRNKSGHCYLKSNDDELERLSAMCKGDARYQKLYEE